MWRYLVKGQLYAARHEAESNRRPIVPESLDTMDPLLVLG